MMTSQAIKITGPGQWSDWADAGDREYFTAHVKGEVASFAGDITVQRKMPGDDDGAAETLRAISSREDFTISGQGEWLYRAGVAEGAEWSGEVLLVVVVSD